MINKVDVVLGLQWGDEGKGKIVDFLTPEYNVIARFQGGPNAGHSLEFDGIKHVLHTIPSGVFHRNKLNIIGNGVVIDPILFSKEVSELLELNVKPFENIVISKKAHIILPSHKRLDALNEHLKGDAKIGSTLKGIGPTYKDKIGRDGLRIGDILEEDFIERYNSIKLKHQQIFRQNNFDSKIDDIEFLEGIETLKNFKMIDSENEINTLINSGEKLLAEGAQGTLLDIDFGTYPFVTSSNTVCAGACTGLGIAPNKIGNVFGIFKAYITRVGSGPFTTELFDADGDKLRDKGHEYGSTTGRPRRCGWMDLVALKYVIMLNGVTDLIMTKADVLDDFETIKVATNYEKDGVIVSEMPYDITGWKPIYEELPGWNMDTTKLSKYSEFPNELQYYLAYLEENTGVKISIVSLGPDRKQTIKV